MRQPLPENYEQEFKKHINLPALPDKLWNLLRAAYMEAKSLSRERFQPDSGVWYHNRRSGNCVVCLSGAILAKRYKSVLPHNDVLSLREFDSLIQSDNARKLRTIDSIRSLDFSALDRFGYVIERDVAVSIAVELSNRNELYGWEEFDNTLDAICNVISILRWEDI